MTGHPGDLFFVHHQMNGTRRYLTVILILRIARQVLRQEFFLIK